MHRLDQMMPNRRSAVLIATVILAAGAARSQVSDVPVGSLTVNYIDVELNSSINRMAFNDQWIDGNSWVANVDPHTGLFTSPDGLD